MTRQMLSHGWSVRTLPAGSAAEVCVPHDAMIGEPRSPTAASGAHGAFFPGGHYEYVRELSVPVGAEVVSLVFEGVQGEATITIDGTVAGGNWSPYREFEVDITHLVTAGRTHTVKVDVDNTSAPSARWYTGSGLYRPVWLRTTGRARFAVDGIDARPQFTTAGWSLEVATTIDRDRDNVSVEVQLIDGNHVLASASGSPGTITLQIPDASPWTQENPYLYTLRARVITAGRESERIEAKVGFRTVHVDAQQGLLINGEPTKLRGACIHHDNGILGAATFRAAEFRRAWILRQQGYNAVRSAHNPLSRDFLDACDELGLYVLDELTDVWFTPKTPHDGATRFEELWPSDATSMVAKDRLHPSVIMYSIGNEISESASPAGVDAAHRISRFVQTLDPTRPTTLATNFVLSMLAGSKDRRPDPTATNIKTTAPTSTTVNAISNRVGRVIRLVTRLPKADSLSRAAFAAVDVAGYNYGWVRYKSDTRRYPDRVILGSESFPGEIAEIWAVAQRLPNVIGDFAWTGWEYLGEVGLATWTYGADRYRQARAWPQITSGGGALDLSGNQGALMLLARAVWGIDARPGIAVRPINHAAEPVNRMLWRGTDAVPSWAWRGNEGRAAEVEVYSAAEEIELIVNGQSRGRRPAGPRRGHVARFTLPYEKGELVAIARTAGVEVGRNSLRSAGSTTVQIVPEPELPASAGADVTFVPIQLADADGTVEMLDDDDLELSVSGGTLVALGNAAPATTESFTDATHRTFQGRALAVVRAHPRSTHVTVDVTSGRHGATRHTFTVSIHSN